MAYYNQEEDENLNPDQQQAGGVQTAPQAAMAQPGAPGAAAGGGAGAKTPDNPGNFVGIKSYLDANKNQASKLGDQASGVINQSAQGARDSVSGLQNTFTQAAGSPVAYDPSINQKIGQGAEKLSEQEKQQAKNQYNAQYSGPMDLMDQNLSGQYTEAQKKLNAAKTNVESSGTEQGRKNLITQVNDKPRTAGVTNFDNILLQSGSGRDKLAQASQANKDVTGDVLGQANTQAAQLAQANKAAADKARTETQNAVSGAQSEFSKQFDPNDPNSRLAQAISKALLANQDVANDVYDDPYGLTKNNLDLFGLAPGQLSYGANIADYFKQADPTKITAETLATPEEFARAQALAELADGTSLLDQNKIGESGTSDQYLGKIDKEGLLADIGKRASNFQDVWNKQEAKSLTNPKANWAEEMMPALSTGGFRNSYMPLISGHTPQELKTEIVPKLLSAAANQWNDPTGKISDVGILAQNIKKYLADLDSKSKGKKFSATGGQ